MPLRRKLRFLFRNIFDFLSYQVEEKLDVLHKVVNVNHLKKAATDVQNTKKQNFQKLGTIFTSFTQGKSCYDQFLSVEGGGEFKLMEKRINI